MLTVITYSYMFVIIICNDMLIMMQISDIVVRQLCYILTMICASCGSYNKKLCNQ
jgi:hypothetical protein